MATQGAGSQGKRGCFRTGCFGCLGVLLLAVVLPLIWGFIEIARGVPEGERQTRDMARILPGGSAAPDAGQQVTVPPAALAGGRVILDISMAEFSIEQGPAGDPIRVEADYDTRTYELVEEFTGEGELGWTYNLRFRPSVSWLRRLLAGTDEQHGKVRLILPRGTPMSLAGNVGIGESKLELGGLWLTDVDLDIGIGSHTIRFSEPLPQPLEALRLDSSLGEVRVHGVGHASPHQVRLGHSVGEVRFDLRGDWRNDSEVEIACGIGECDVRLPGDEVNVELVRAAVTIGEARHPRREKLAQAPPGAPTLRVDISGTIGEVSVDD